MVFPAFRPGTKKLLSRTVSVEMTPSGHKSTVSKLYLLTGHRKALRA
jgi:hypothetical protein